MATQAPFDPAVSANETALPPASTSTAQVGNGAPHNGAGYAAPGGQPPKDDMTEWIDRIKAAIDKPETVTAPSPAGATSWNFGFWDFCNPPETCMITYCCPCVTFGKTHHRLRKDPNLRDYSMANASCCAFWISAMFCGHICLQMLQRHDIRSRNNLEGDCAGDCLRGWCCPWCDLVQQDKEAEYQALHNANRVVADQPGAKAEMQMQPPAA